MKILSYRVLLGLFKLISLHCAHTHVFRGPEYLILLVVIYQYNEYLRKYTIGSESARELSFEKRHVFPELPLVARS